MDLGIVGLARAGKTTLFNAVTRGHAKVGAYSSKAEPNVGVVHVPDERLAKLAAIFKAKKVTYAETRWVDFPAGFSAEGPGAQFLAQLARMDALVHVVRAFEDESVPHPDSSVDPHRDVETLNLELAFADLALIERRLARIEAEMRSVKTGERGAMERDRALLETAKRALEEGRAVRELELDEEATRHLAQYQFVTRRPMLLVINVGERDAGRSAEVESQFAARHGGPGVAVVAVCAKLESELAALDPAEAREFRAGLDLAGEPALDRAIHAAHSVLGLHTFLTIGDEARAWSLPVGATALEAAGKIHSDIERGFIRAEVARWDELADAASFGELRRRGALRTEGKAYVVRDGDVLNILFNV